MKHLKIGKTERYLLEKLERGEKIHLLLLDPEEVPTEDAGRIARESEEAGSDGIMVGGSTFFSQSVLDEFVKVIKENISLRKIHPSQL